MCRDDLESFQPYLDHAYAKDLANLHITRIFANLKTDTVYALYPEIFATKILLSGKILLFLTLPELPGS